MGRTINLSMSLGISISAYKYFESYYCLSHTYDPCPMMLVQPTLDDCQSYSKDEISPMLRDTPCLQGLVSDPNAKDGKLNVGT